MDGTMNKDVKIGLAIGLLALIALFCLFVFNKKAPPPETEPVATDTEREAMSPADDSLPTGVGVLPPHGVTDDTDDRMVATLGGHGDDAAVDTAPGHVRVGDDDLIDLTPRAVNPDTTEVIRTRPPEIDLLPVVEPPLRVSVVATRTYVVQNNDSFTGISKKEYGDARYWQKIMDANGMTDPLALRVGQEIIIPPLTDTTTRTETGPALTAGRTHKVARGETLGDISTLYYGTTRHYKVIMEANHITDERSVPVGRVLVIPDLPTAAAGLPEQPDAPAPVEADGARTIHVVRAGETLSDISRQHYGTVKLHKLIMDANGITDPTRVLAGQRLVIPPKPADAESGVLIHRGALRPGEESYVVREGDTLIDIARQFYHDARHYDLIMKRNGIADARDLRAGTAIIIPPLSERSLLMETRATD